MNVAIGVAEEETDTSGMKRVGAKHHGNLPRLGEKAVVDFEVGLGEEDLAARVRVIPSDNARAAVLRGKQLFQARFIVARERKRGSEGVFAIEGDEVGDGEPVALPRPEQNAADLSPA